MSDGTAGRQPAGGAGGEAVAGAGGLGEGGGGSADCPIGTQNCPCREDSTCDAGLTCASGLCLDLYGGSGGQHVCFDNSRPSCADDALIDDMLGGGIICPNDGKRGYWYTATDGTAGGTIGPDPFVMQDEGIGRMWGNGFDEWVALGVFVTSCDSSTPFDARAYAGIAVRADCITGISSGDQEPPVDWLGVVIWTSDTTSPEHGGTCVPDGGLCDSHYRFWIPCVIGSWYEMDILWDDLSQSDEAADTGEFNPGNILRIEFRIDFEFGTPGADFDVNIANLAFIP